MVRLVSSSSWLLLVLAALLGALLPHLEPAAAPVNCADVMYAATADQSSDQRPGEQDEAGLLFRWAVGHVGRATRFAGTDPATRLPVGHAHNDYEHRSPLLGALREGFASVEVDVWAVGDSLLVGHTRDELDATRTLRSLYLDRLWDRRVQMTNFQLLIDVKSDPAATMPLLRRELARYRPMLVRRSGCSATTAPVSVVVSGTGREPRAPETPQLFAYDWQPDKGAGLSGTFGQVPLVSLRWSDFLGWSKGGPLKGQQAARLQALVRAVHSGGSSLRLWGLPEGGEAPQQLWCDLVRAGVDYLATDRVQQMGRFLRSDADTCASATRTP